VRQEEQRVLLVLYFPAVQVLQDKGMEEEGLHRFPPLGTTKIISPLPQAALQISI
jgi:hypothetical protein